MAEQHQYCIGIPAILPLHAKASFEIFPMHKSRIRTRGAKGRSFNNAPSKSLRSETARFVAFCIFVAGVFLMGGGSRGDIISLVILRPFAVLVAAYALFVAEPGALRQVRWPLLMLGLLALLMMAQLVPLPQSWWTALPGRDLYAVIGNDAGMEPIYRPLSLSPSRTLNSLLSLTVPFATILILAVQGQAYQRKVFIVIAGAGAVSVVWAIAQVAGPAQGPLYTYNVTNNGFPVGPFANRNHLALLLAILLVLIGFFARRSLLSGTIRPFFAAALGAGALVVLALLLVAGSRAGLALAPMAILAACSLVYGGYRKVNPELTRKGKLVLGLAVAAGLGAIVILTVISSKATSLERLSSGDALADSRVERLPLILEMIEHHWLAGIGFGAFESVFKNYETIDVLTGKILNQAHSDWLQLVIEGGLPAACLVAAAVAWTIDKGLSAVGLRTGRFDAAGFTAVAVLGLVALASVVDYPLRTPIIMFICATCFTILAQREHMIKIGGKQDLGPRTSGP